jgi:hypothetical protein
MDELRWTSQKEIKKEQQPEEAQQAVNLEDLMATLLTSVLRSYWSSSTEESAGLTRQRN